MMMSKLHNFYFIFRCL